MADQPDHKEPDVEPADNAPSERLTVAEWQARSSWFVVGEGPASAHALVGALHGEDSEKRFTRDQVQKRLEKWLKAEPETEAV